MAHRQQKLIDELLGEAEAENDHSLQKQALDRATGDKIPTTLTPWEWQEYYAAHGVPESHKPSARPAPAKPWWRRLLSLD